MCNLSCLSVNMSRFTEYYIDVQLHVPDDFVLADLDAAEGLDVVEVGLHGARVQVRRDLLLPVALVDNLHGLDRKRFGTVPEKWKRGGHTMKNMKWVTIMK